MENASNATKLGTRVGNALSLLKEDMKFERSNQIVHADQESVGSPVHHEEEPKSGESLLLSWVLLRPQKKKVKNLFKGGPYSKPNVSPKVDVVD